MAIGNDMALRPAAGKSPLAPPKPAGSPMGVPSFAPPTLMVNDGAVQDMVNNQLASAVGSGRAALSAGDRAGLSRGRGQQRVADMAEAGADVEARGAAAQTEMAAAGANASARAAYENSMRNENLQNAGLLEQLRSNTEQARTAQMRWRQDMQQAMRRGQFDLGNIQQANYGQLMSSLLQQLLS